jgi:hypothetical protein
MLSYNGTGILVILANGAPLSNNHRHASKSGQDSPRLDGQCVTGRSGRIP